MVDNKPGASGNVAASEVIRATPDGYTFLIAPTSFETANPFLFKQTIAPAKDLTPVAGVGRSQMYLVVKPESPSRTPRNSSALPRANPGKLSYARPVRARRRTWPASCSRRSPAPLSPTFPTGAPPPHCNDVMANQADYVFDPGIAFQHVRAGKVRMLAVAGAKRSSFFPDVPTLRRTGFQGAELDIWFGMWAPNGTPADITAYGREIAKALASPTPAALRSLGAEPVGWTTHRIQVKLLGQRNHHAVESDQGSQDQHRLSASSRRQATMNEAPVQVETQGRVGVITLNRPRQLNALNDALMDGWVRPCWPSTATPA
jgi:tripartite-type tricarboxylate transporter receptor subunit TctC